MTLTDSLNALRDALDPATRSRDLLESTEMTLDVEASPDGYPVKLRATGDGIDLVVFGEPDTELRVPVAGLVEALEKIL